MKKKKKKKHGRFEEMFEKDLGLFIDDEGEEDHGSFC